MDQSSNFWKFQKHLGHIFEGHRTRGEQFFGDHGLKHLDHSWIFLCEVKKLYTPET